jgi:hypothetical protein
MRHRILFISLILLVALTAVAFQQSRMTAQTSQQSNEEQAKMLGLIRTIGTLEFSDYSETGSYESWPALMKRHSKELNDWLAANGFAQTSFASSPEIVPGWKLRLTPNSEGHGGYLLLMEDIHDKDGFAYISDGSVIRQGKYIN